MNEEISSELIGYITSHTSIEEGEITENSTLDNFPDCDSLDLIELLSFIEEKYGYYIPDDELIKLDTFGDLVDNISANI